MNPKLPDNPRAPAARKPQEEFRNQLAVCLAGRWFTCEDDLAQDQLAELESQVGERFGGADKVAMGYRYTPRPEPEDPMGLYDRSAEAGGYVPISDRVLVVDERGGRYEIFLENGRLTVRLVNPSYFGSGGMAVIPVVSNTIQISAP